MGGERNNRGRQEVQEEQLHRTQREIVTKNTNTKEEEERTNRRRFGKLWRGRYVEEWQSKLHRRM